MKGFLDRLARYAGSPERLLRSAALALQARAVARSPLFDGQWYLRQNPDLAASGGSPALHYVFAGAGAGLDPGPGFCGREYLDLNPEARAAGMNPLAHYERTGRGRGLRISHLQPVLADGRADPGWRFPSLEWHQASFPAKVAAIRAKAARGERVRAVFFVANAAMFPAGPLFEAMSRDARFDARLCVVPDLRGISSEDPAAGMERCRSALAARYPAGVFLDVARDGAARWPDVVGDFGADVVCHPSPYDLSDFRYNPRWCVGRPVLPVYVNYGYPCTAFAAPAMGLANYALQWKVFLESDAVLSLYGGVSPVAGANGEVVGSVKMDRLPAGGPMPGARKRVLICPHHSVEGGANAALELSNFMRYADFFARLPGRFPEIDFTFRPHPFLFPVLARPKFWGAARCADWRRRFLSHPNAQWTDGGDPLRDFGAADAIVQDCASFLADWMFTGRPCCYMLKSAADLDGKFNAIGRECLRHCQLAFCEDDIAGFIRDVVIGGRDAKAEGRMAFSRSIAVNWPHAAEAALSAIARHLFQD